MTSIQAWSLVSEKRAMIYQWFSGIFAQELSDEQFDFYKNQKADEWFSIFELIGLEDEVSELKKSIQGWTQHAFDSVELRADFASLFLVDSRRCAIPYASCYIEKSGLAYGEIHSRMKHFLEANHLELSADFKEPADHIAVYLALMNTWILDAQNQENIRQTAQEQAQFLENTLLNWLPIFVARCQDVDVLSRFYPAVACLLLAFVSMDLQYLKEQQ